MEISSKYSLNAPVFGSIAMLLSLRITRIFALEAATLFNPSKAIPPVIEPSPITAITFLFSLLNLEAMAIPSAAETEVEECPTPKESCSLSFMFGNPLMPPRLRFV